MTKRSLRILVAVAATLPGVAGAMAQAPSGLDALSEDRLQAELAGRGLNSLLERAFEANQVPAEQRQATRALIALRELTDAGRRLSQREVDALVLPLVSGMEAALPTQRDPLPLVAQAERVIETLVFPQLNALEYWGETPANTARLRPVATVASRMLARAAELARTQADEIANRLTSPNDPNIARYEQLEALAVKAEYTRRMNDYAVVASMDVADPARSRLAEEVVEYLRQFDNPESTVQPTVRVQIGKLLVAAGRWREAVAVLDDVWRSPESLAPAPSAAQQFEARYFAAVAVLRSGDAAGAMSRLEDIRAWQADALGPAGPATMAGVEAAGMMLQYRIELARGNDAQARQVLVDLVRRRPEFEGIVLDQMVGRLPPRADFPTTDGLVLRAVFRRGEAELAKGEGQPPDMAVLDDAIAAGHEIVSRRNRGTTDAALAEDTALRLPLLLERAGRTIEAAGALLGYIETFGSTRRNARVALDEATYLIARLRQENPDDLDVGKLYERLLSLAVNPPFNRRELAYEWARRLQTTGRFADAVRYFEQVPPDDPRAELARFFRMVALKQLLDDPAAALPEAERARRAQEILDLASEVSAQARLRDAQPGRDDVSRRNDKLILVRSALVGSDVALREQKDPTRALRMLEGFDAAAAGLAGERDLVAQAMNVRVLALMELGRNEEATRTLVTLLEKTGGNDGADMVFRLLTRLNADFDRAKASGDAAAVRSLAKSRAGLSGFLVQWAQSHPDPAIRESTYRYRVFDAETKRLAADLETDPAARSAGLQTALGLYQALRQTPAGANDPVVQLGFALISFDLGDYAVARDNLAMLLEQRRLGRPTEEQDRSGEVVTVLNDRYWEATLKLFQATLRLIDSGQVEPDARTPLADGLRALYARWGRGMGGPRWGPGFEELRRQLAAEYVPPDLNTP